MAKLLIVICAAIITLVTLYCAGLLSFVTAQFDCGFFETAEASGSGAVDRI